MSTTFVTLPSADPSCLPGSTSGDYTVDLGRTLDFSSGSYSVFLAEARFTLSWYNVDDGENELRLSGGPTVTLHPGYYESVKVLCQNLNDLLSSASVVFTPLNLERKVQVEIPAGKTLTGSPLRLLGFPTAKVGGVGTQFKSLKPADVNLNRSSIFVYSSVVRNSLVGNFLVPLLHEIPLPGNARFGDLITYRQPLPVETRQLNVTLLRSIETNLKFRDNTTVNFKGEDVSITLGIQPVS